MATRAEPMTQRKGGPHPSVEERRAHARSGDPIATAAYLGKRDQFDWSIADFSQRYADQNERDYQAFANAIRSGRLQALEGVQGCLMARPLTWEPPRCRYLKEMTIS